MQIYLSSLILDIGAGDNHKDDPVTSRLPKVDVYSSADQLREQLEEKDKELYCC